MRIISVIVSTLAIIGLIFPQIALAGNLDTNIKTNFKVKKDISISNGIISSRLNTLENIPYNYEGYEPVEIKTKEELKREKVLSRWKRKQIYKWDSLPKGRFTINASAYTAAADECGWNTGITASGLKVEKGRTLACPPEYPFGAKVEIEGYGIYTCEDRGGAIKGNHFDIYMETKSEAFSFGRRNLIAQVVQ